MIDKILNFFGIYLYVRVNHIHGGFYVCELKDIIAMSEEDQAECWVEPIWMTRKEFNEIEEFMGF